MPDPDVDTVDPLDDSDPANIPIAESDPIPIQPLNPLGAVAMQAVAQPNFQVTAAGTDAATVQAGCSCIFISSTATVVPLTQISGGAFSFAAANAGGNLYNITVTPPNNPPSNNVEFMVSVPGKPGIANGQPQAAVCYGKIGSGSGTNAVAIQNLNALNTKDANGNLLPNFQFTIVGTNATTVQAGCSCIFVDSAANKVPLTSKGTGFGTITVTASGDVYTVTVPPPGGVQFPSHNVEFMVYVAGVNNNPAQAGVCYGAI